ncbi:MAG: ABC transporter permease [Treponema sp.]|nr:ABC transporter permease [Treponema sp.]
MTFRSSFLYALRLFFSKSKSSEKSHGNRSLFGAMLCIGISLVPLVGVLVISTGMIDGITGRMIGLSTQDLQVRVNSYSLQVDSPEKMYEISSRIKTVDGVNEVYPEMQGMGLMVANGIRCGASVRAVPSDIFTRSENFSTLFKVIDGKASLDEERGAVLGEKIADDLGVKPGDGISFVTVNKVGETIVPKMSRFTVTGIVSSGYQELDAIWVFIPLETGYQVLSQKSCQFIFGIETPDPFSPSLMAIRNDVTDELFGVNGNEEIEQFRVYTWNEINSAEYENFASTKVLLLLIMLLIVMVASVNISSALVMIVMERRREIAILKSTGGTAEGIAVSFLIVGMGAGAGGVLIGIPLGLLGAVNINGLIKIIEWIINICGKFVYLIGNGDLSGFNTFRLLDPAYYLQDIPVSVSFSDLLLITVGTLLLSLLVSVIPAVKAGREKPLDTLRKV